MKKHRFIALLLCITLCLGMLGSAMASSTDASTYLMVFDAEMQNILKEFPQYFKPGYYSVTTEEYFGEERGSIYMNLDTFEVVVYSLISKTTYTFYDEDVGMIFMAYSFLKLDSSDAVSMNGGVRVFGIINGKTEEMTAADVSELALLLRSRFN